MTSRYYVHLDNGRAMPCTRWDDVLAHVRIGRRPGLRAVVRVTRAAPPPPLNLTVYPGGRDFGLDN